MNKSSFFSIAVAILCACLPSMAQTTTKLTASKANEYGMIYSLPITAIDVVIETEHSVKEPGEFSNYARHNLNITNAITQPSQSATVKSVTLVPRGIADNSNRWIMQFKGTQNVYAVLNDQNVPIAINTENIPAPASIELPVAKAAEPTPLETDAAQHAMTQEMIQSTNKSKRAQLATERIFELRENRNDLISGQADNTPPDGKAMQLALDALAAQEAALTAMFAGTEKKWTEVNTVTFTPNAEEVSNLVLARLSPTEGLIEADDLAGKPIYISMEIISQGEIPADEKGEPKPFPKGGVAYQIPGLANITVSYDGNVLASQPITLAQLGVPYGLDPKNFVDKTSPAFMLLDPTTGGIITLGIKE